MNYFFFFFFLKIELFLQLIEMVSDEFILIMREE